MAEKWTWEQLHKAVEDHQKNHDANWSEKGFEEAQKQERQEWYLDRSEAYQNGFERVLKEAGWTRNEYCDEYDLRIGWNIGAGHPANYMTKGQKIAAGLGLLALFSKDLDIHANMEEIRVYSGDWSAVDETGKFTLSRYGFRYEPENIHAFGSECGYWIVSTKYVQEEKAS